jgi:hypothetical protein
MTGSLKDDKKDISKNNDREQRSGRLDFLVPLAMALVILCSSLAFGLIASQKEEFNKENNTKQEESDISLHLHTMSSPLTNTIVIDRGENLENDKPGKSRQSQFHNGEMNIQRQDAERLSISQSEFNSRSSQYLTEHNQFGKSSPLRASLTFTMGASLTVATKAPLNLDTLDQIKGSENDTQTVSVPFFSSERNDDASPSAIYEGNTGHSQEAQSSTNSRETARSHEDVLPAEHQSHTHQSSSHDETLLKHIVEKIQEENMNHEKAIDNHQVE